MWILKKISKVSFTLKNEEHIKKKFLLWLFLIFENYLYSNESIKNNICTIKITIKLNLLEYI